MQGKKNYSEKLFTGQLIGYSLTTRYLKATM